MTFFQELKIRFIRKHIKDKLLRKMSLATTTWEDINNDPAVTPDALFRQYELLVDLLSRKFDVVSPSWYSIFVMDYVVDSLTIYLVEKIFNSVRPKKVPEDTVDDIETAIRFVNGKRQPTQWMMWHCFLPLHLYALEVIIEKHPAGRDHLGRTVCETT